MDDLNNSINEPAWLQELTNNYKKLHLNKLWYLLPSAETKMGNDDASNVDLNKENSSSAASSAAQISAQNAPMDEQSNVAYGKHEPSSIEPMPQYQQVDFSQQQQQQQHQYEQQQMIQQPEANNNNNNNNHNEQLNYDMNRLNLGNNQQQYAQQQPQYHEQQQPQTMQTQHSMPFVPENQVVNNYEPNTNDAYYQQNQTNSYDAQMPPPQQPVYQPQQGAYFNPNDSTFQSRKSSIASVNQHHAEYQPQQHMAAGPNASFYDPNANKQRNLSSNSTSELTITDHYQNAMNLQQQQQQQYQGKYPQGSATLPRSRQSSVSTNQADNVPFAPFVPYQPTAGNDGNQQFYDPSAGGQFSNQQQPQQPQQSIQKSQTFPVPSQQSNYYRPDDSNDNIAANNQTNDDSGVNAKPKTKPKTIFDEDDEDEFNTTKKSDASSKADNSKLSQQQQQQAANKVIFSQLLIKTI